MSAALDAMLQPIVRTRGVRAALLAAEDDGVAVHALAHDDVDVDTLAALGCRLYRSARLAGERAGFGTSSTMHVEADDGHICVARAAAAEDGLVLIALADKDVNAGTLRLTLARVAGGGA